ncbi:MAG: hypothetical protein RL630_2341 [Verrucomicrobiota bacterium]|jgi:hypothetical protein
MKTTALALLFATAMPLLAQDVILLKNGSRRAGEIASADETTLRLRVSLDTGSAPSGSATATIGIPRTDIEAIEFQADPKRDERLRSATPAQLPEVENDWKKTEPWLSAPRSQAGAIGCKLGDLLLATNDPTKAAAALELFSRIEKESWSEQDRVRAKQGRLRAMVATGRAAEAIEQAKQLAAETENPEILIEANYIMAQAAEADFKAFLEENPRWDQDPYVIDQRHHLYNRVLELYLYPSLFHGSDDTRSARGLWGAVSVYRASNQLPLAIETARDITVLYPATTEAKLAQEFLASLKPEELASDFEAEARKELEEGMKESPAPTPDLSPEPESTKPETKKKKKT